MIIGFNDKINKDLGRPVVRLREYFDLFALIDTGASLPVWVADEDIMIKIFNPTLVKTGLSFSGFGGSTLGDLYKINFKFGDLYFPNMPIVAAQLKDINYHMILSATLFTNLLYAIDDKNSELKVAAHNGDSLVRYLEVTKQNKRYRVSCVNDVYED